MCARAQTGGTAWAPDGALWTVVNQRDELGSDLVPRYLAAVREGGRCGWPCRRALPCQREWTAACSLASRAAEDLESFRPERDPIVIEEALQAGAQGAAGEAQAFEPNHEGSPVVCRADAVLAFRAAAAQLNMPLTVVEAPEEDEAARYGAGLGLGLGPDSPIRCIERRNLGALAA